MHSNVLSELILVEEYYNEYLSLINQYHNFNRQSVFCRYYNINKSFSTYQAETESTFDYYNSGLSYDIFEYCPLFYASQVVNDGQDQADLMGQMFLGNLNVVIYTIDEPKINDLITFPFKPNTSSEIFKVTNIRVPINAKTSQQKLKWYELTLETAPIKDMDKLKLVNRWVYSLNLQKNMYYDDFERMVQELQKIEVLFKDLNNFFDQKTELFYYVDPVIKEKIAPLQENAMIFDYLTTIMGYHREFEYAWRPFGVTKYGIKGTLNLTTGQTVDDYQYYGAKLYDGGYDEGLDKIIVTTPTGSKLNILDYDKEINVYDMTSLLNTWVWRNKIPLNAQYTEFVDENRLAHAGYDKELQVAEYDDEVQCIDDNK